MKIPQAKRLPSGQWRVQVSVNGQRLSITRDTEKQAIADAVALKAGAAQAHSSAKITLTQAIDRYIEGRENVLSPSTIRGYRIIQRNRFRRMMNRAISSVPDNVWQRAVNDEARLCSAKTLQNAWRFISTVIVEGTGHRPSVRLPQVVLRPREYLAAEQIPAFLEAVKGSTVELPALLALSSLRCSEILGLRWKDFDGKAIHVNGASVPGPGGNRVRKAETKNQSSRRTVPVFIPRLLELLEASRGKQDESIVTMTEAGIRRHINRLCQKAGLPEVGIHGLRKSFASLAYSLGLPPKVTMAVGGWSDDRTMLRIYTEVSEAEITEKVGKMRDYFLDT